MAYLTHAACMRLAGGALLTLVAATAWSTSASAASSTSSPRPIADVHSLGPITLWDRDGHRLTGGSTSAPLNTEIAKATAPGPAPAGYRYAVELNMWTPRDGADPSQWNGGPLRAGTPDLISAQAQTAPLSTANISSWSLQRDIPLANGPSTGAYANRYELRLTGIQFGPAFSPDYYTATIMVDPKTARWQIVGPATSSAGSRFPAAAVGGSIGGGVLVLLLGGAWWHRRHSETPSRNAHSLEAPEQSTI